MLELLMGAMAGEPPLRCGARNKPYRARAKGFGDLRRPEGTTLRRRRRLGAGEEEETRV
jgi:hypothetical protein